MLAKKYRLNRKEINLIYKKGRGKRGGEMGVKYLTNTLANSRYSVIIPKAVVKKVTERNRFRRVIFDEISRLKPVRNLDIIVRVFRISDEKSLRTSVQNILKSLDV
ncbi:MAG: ribonuclease P protein component [Patescibacteria group bacterium]|jgi:ribonuclease P protein component